MPTSPSFILPATGSKSKASIISFPVDAVLERDIDAFDEAIPLDRILTVIEPVKKLRLVILDACRDSPFRKTKRNNLASRGVGRGLVRVEPDSPNTMIAYAAKAGSIAIDGDDKNSPFTAALVKYLPDQASICAGRSVLFATMF